MPLVSAVGSSSSGTLNWATPITLSSTLGRLIEEAELVTLNANLHVFAMGSGITVPRHVW